MPKMDIQWISNGYPFHTQVHLLGISTNIHGYPFLSMDIHGLSISRNCGYSWIFNGYPKWILVDIFIHFKTTMNIARMVSRSMDIHGYPWISILYGYPFRISINGYPWIISFQFSHPVHPVVINDFTCQPLWLLIQGVRITCPMSSNQTQKQKEICLEHPWPFVDI